MPPGCPQAFFLAEHDASLANAAPPILLWTMRESLSPCSAHIGSRFTALHADLPRIGPDHPPPVQRLSTAGLRDDTAQKLKDLCFPTGQIFGKSVKTV